jgi:hypothetical protein
MYVSVYPIYGLVFGFSYWNSDMDGATESIEEVKEHAIQLTLGIIGVTFTIWKEV